MEHRRVVLHIDLDAFYAQVEMKRLGIPRDVPVAVQQWEGLIAVNYAARDNGITRHMRVAEARKVCPNIRLVHVETIGEGGPVEADDEDGGAGGERGGPGAGGGGGSGSAARRTDSKACLQRYRMASGDILRLLGSLLGSGPGGGGGGGVLLEKASIDEVFVDVTSMVDEELRRAEAGQDFSRLLAPGRTPTAELPAAAAADAMSDLAADPEADAMPAALAAHGEADPDEWLQGEADGGPGAGAQGAVPPALLAAAREVVQSSVVLGGPPQLMNETDRRLIIGALIALRLRRAVRQQLDFTCSAGIATNKLLSKVGSARNKPDKQTLVLPRGVADLMADMPLGKLRGLGGKLGAALEQHCGATTAGQVQALGMELLAKHLGPERARWVHHIVRGQCFEPVTPKDKVKSINSCKSFDSTRDLATLGRWLGILAEELQARLAADEQENRRRAKTLVLHYRSSATWGSAASGERSVRGSMPQYGRGGPPAAAVAAEAMRMFRRLTDALPCSRLAIAATDFTEMPTDASRSIQRFFQKSAAPEPQRAQQQRQQQQRQRQQQEGCGAEPQEPAAKRQRREQSPAVAPSSPGPSVQQPAVSAAVDSDKCGVAEGSGGEEDGADEGSGWEGWGGDGGDSQVEDAYVEPGEEIPADALERGRGAGAGAAECGMQSGQRAGGGDGAGHGAGTQAGQGEGTQVDASLACWLEQGSGAAAAAAAARGGVSASGLGIRRVEGASANTHDPGRQNVGDVPVGEEGAGLNEHGGVLRPGGPTAVDHGEEWQHTEEEQQQHPQTRYGHERPEQVERDEGPTYGGDGGQEEQPQHVEVQAEGGQQEGADALLSGVDLAEQRAILHEIELARLRAIGRTGDRGQGPAAGGGRGGSRGGGGGSGGRGAKGRGGAGGRQQPKDGGKQMSISALLGGKPRR